MKISQKVSELLNGHNFPIKILKGHNSIKTVGGVTFPNLCTSPDGALFCTKVHGTSQSVSDN